MASLSEQWRSLQARLTREYVETKNAINVHQRLSEEYEKLDSAGQREVDEELARWLTSDDEGLRFDALGLIRSQRVNSAIPELRDLAERLASDDSPGAPFERKKVIEVIGKLDPGEAERYPHWWPSDALVFACLPSRMRGRVTTILGSADAINRTYPSREELEHAIGFLGAAGLVNPKRLCLARAGRQLRRDGPRFERSLDELVRVERELLERIPVPPRGIDWSISDADYRRALDSYLGEHK